MKRSRIPILGLFLLLAACAGTDHAVADSPELATTYRRADGYSSAPAAAHVAGSQTSVSAGDAARR
ncbi:MAG: hypothetical protein H6838_09255 [Planctomycetes bacterium]|nr:hypothetical protein [Planctomycetota bacterium]